ncbi:MAG: vWA domain-containing protein [Pirellulales bacterium]
MTGRLPAWLAEWLGVELPAAGDSATWQLEATWHWPPWATVLLVLIAILWTITLYTREASTAGRGYRALLAFLRMTAIALILIMLAQWALALRLTGPPAFALVIDRSASMGIDDRNGDPEQASRLAERLSKNGLTDSTRLSQAKLFSTENDGRLLAELARRYRLEVYFAAAGIERQQHTADSASMVAAIRGLTLSGADSQATRLGDAVRHVLEDFRGAPPAGILLLTDGVNTEGLPLADAALEARQKGVPILAVGLGRDDPPRDVELADVLVDDAVFVDDLVSFQIQVKATGLEGQGAEVVLRREDSSGATGTASVVAKQNIVLPPTGETLTLQLVDRPTEPGDVAYVVEIAPRDDETNPDNNRQRRVVAVRDAKIRVLAVFGYPSYEFRFLKTMLERDSTIQLSTYLQDADPEYTEQDKAALRALPVGRDELFEYDVLVIGDVDPRLLPRSLWPVVRAFVAEKGGGVVFIAGPRYLPWNYRDNADVGALLPIDMDSLPLAADNRLPAAVTRGFVVTPTPLGLRTAPMQLGNSPTETEQIWQHLAPLFWLAEVGGLKPAAQVLAVGPDTQSTALTLTRAGSSPSPTNAEAHSALPTPHSALPVICFQYFGAGRVLFHAVDSTWRWRIGVGDVFFARYWVQTVRYLARGKLTSGRGVELATDRREFRRGDPVQLRARFRDARLAPTGAGEVTILVESPVQVRRRATLHRNPTAAGVFEGVLADLGEGQYQAILAEPQLPGDPPAARFAVVAPPGELTRTEMDRAALTAAAETTHGKFYTIDDTDRLLNDLPAGRRVPIENLPPIPLWNRWWLLSLFLACITTEWVLRKRKGML